MLFCETDVIEVPHYQNSFIYFLVKNGEVVYVGQTKKGIVRPLSHKNKEYDSIYIKYCNELDLDMLEDKYILKYRPRYNKAYNNIMRYGLTRAKTLIRKETNKKDFNLWDLKKLLKKLNIEPELLYGISTITVFEFKDVLDYVKENF